MEQIINEIWGFKDPKKKEIDDLMKRLTIEETHYKVNANYTVDLIKDVVILTKKMYECPVVFNIAHGNFTWHYADLKSMKNFPKVCKGNLSVAYNNIESLADSQTTIVEGTFNCSNNKHLKSLKGAPLRCKTLVANDCALESLDGCPEKLDNLWVSRNNLKTLKGCPNKVNSLFDFSYNEITDLGEIEKLIGVATQIKAVGNPVGFDEKDSKFFKDPIKSSDEIQEWKFKDVVIYDKPDSKYHGMKGEISFVSDDADVADKIYQIYFLQSENPSLDKDTTIAKIKGKYLRRFNPTFNFEDQIVFKNKGSKYDNCKGIILGRDMTVWKDNDPHYRVKIPVADNPNIADIVTTANKNKGFVTLTKVKPEQLELIKSAGNKDYAIIRDKGNDFNVGEKVNFNGRKVILLRPQGYLWSVKYEFPVGPKEEDEFQVHYQNLSRPANLATNRFMFGDKIIYLDPGGALDECRGKIMYINYNVAKPICDIEIINKFGSTVRINNIDITSLERDTSGPKVWHSMWKSPEKQSKPKIEETDDTSKKTKKYKKGDKVIYVASKEGDKDPDFHGRKGVISALNIASRGPNGKSGTYDVFFEKQQDMTYARTLYFVDGDNLTPDPDKYSKGDKVIYVNDKKVDDTNGKYCTITNVSKGKYEVTFNINDVQIIVPGVEAGCLTKFTKPKGMEVHEGDEVIYTKSDSKHFGCKGKVLTYEVSEDKFNVEITPKDNTKVVKIKTKDENLELIPPKKIYKKGDKIRYINSESLHDGAIGTISDKKGDRYDLLLKNTRGDTISLTTSIDNILLLEESEDSSELKFGDWAIYKNPESKHNGRIGTFEGIAKEKGGMWSVKFDDTSSYLKLYVDPGTLFPHDPPPGKITSTYATPYTAPAKKKKKKEKPEPRKPVLVYNRRYVARKKYKDPNDPVDLEDEENDEPRDFEVGDKVTVVDMSYSQHLIGKTGEIKSLANQWGRYAISIDGTLYYLTKDQFEAE